MRPADHGRMYHFVFVKCIILCMKLWNIRHIQVPPKWSHNVSNSLLPFQSAQHTDFALFADTRVSTTTFITIWLYMLANDHIHPGINECILQRLESFACTTPTCLNFRLWNYAYLVALIILFVFYLRSDELRFVLDYHFCEHIPPPFIKRTKYKRACKLYPGLSHYSNYPPNRTTMNAHTTIIDTHMQQIERNREIKNITIMSWSKISEYLPKSGRNMANQQTCLFIIMNHNVSFHD